MEEEKEDGGQAMWLGQRMVAGARGHRAAQTARKNELLSFPIVRCVTFWWHERRMRCNSFRGCVLTRTVLAGSFAVAERHDQAISLNSRKIWLRVRCSRLKWMCGKRAAATTAVRRLQEDEFTMVCVQVLVVGLEEGVSSCWCRVQRMALAFLSGVSACCARVFTVGVGDFGGGDGESTDTRTRGGSYHIQKNLDGKCKWHS